MLGPTIVAIFSLGIHPSGMKNAVISPQPMIAPMFGMIMLERNVPNCWTRTRAPARGADSVGVLFVVVVVAMSTSDCPDRGVTPITNDVASKPHDPTHCQAFGHEFLPGCVAFCPHGPLTW